MKWRLISMCLVLSWNTRLAAIYRTVWLSHLRSTGATFWMPKSFNRETNQVISHVVNAIDLYPASADDLATTFCFLSFHDIDEWPKRIQYPVVDRQDIWHEAQSESQKAVRWAKGSWAIRMPCPGDFLMYLMRWMTAFMCAVVGDYMNWLSNCTKSNKSCFVIVK